MPFAQAGNVRLHYEERGEGPETLLFVHGYSGGWVRYEPVMKLLPPGIRSIAVDLRGAGESDKPATGYEMKDFSDDLAAFAGAIGISNFTLVGHSMGGSVAYQFAIDHGDLLKGVVFVTPAGADGISAPSDEMFAEQAKRQADRAYSISVEEKKQFYRPVPEWMYEQSAITLENTSPAFLREAWWAMTNLRLGDRLVEITAPALMIGADHDESIRVDMVVSDYERIPNCGLYVFARCNHWPLLEATEEFAGVLTDFVSGINA
jgi:pimeloyl-ACP methyl ester carboxylesterase